MTVSALGPLRRSAFRAARARTLLAAALLALPGCDGGTETLVPTTVEKIRGDGQSGPAGTAVTVAPAVRVLDQRGDPLAGVAVLFAVSGGGGTVTAASAVTDAQGTASVGTWTLGTAAGPNALTASVPGVRPVTFSATGVPGAPAALGVLAGADQQGTVAQALPVPPAVRVADAFGNAVAGAEVRFQVAAGGGEVEGALQQSDANGVAMVGAWRLGSTAGNHQLLVSVSGGPSTVVVAYAKAGPPAALFRHLGDASSAEVATDVPQPPVVRVVDAFGNAVAGAAVSFQVGVGGGAVEPASAVTDAEGMAAVARWTLGQAAGANTLIAAAQGVAPLTFTATGTPGAPRVAEVAAGEGQSAPAGSPVEVPPAVRVLDAYGNGVPGVEVTFVVVAGGGSVTDAVRLTDASGVASPMAWTLGPTPGENALEARAADLPPVRFDATGTTSTGGGSVENGRFDITLRFGAGLTPSQRAVFEQAVSRWEEVITGDLAQRRIVLPQNACGTHPPLDETVDDLLIHVTAVSIDGVLGVLGRAGPCYIRSAGFLPIVGFMELDAADLAALEASGNLLTVILHELGHVIGIGTVWRHLDLLNGAGGTHPVFTGPQAIAAFDAVGGVSYSGGKVPVENTGGSGTRDSHWRESVLGAELMTGYLNSAEPNPLSLVTIASLADIGYQVDPSRAEAYALGAAPMPAPGAPRAHVELIEIPLPPPRPLGPDGVPPPE